MRFFYTHSIFFETLNANAHKTALKTENLFFYKHVLEFN
jgi:hypothetical protein